MQLCSVCNSANADAFEEGQCHICEGKAPRIREMIEEASAMLEKDGAKSFSISSIIPKGWLTREEEVWDRRMAPGTESIKSLINRMIASALRRHGDYRAEGDVRLTFDLGSGKVSMEMNDTFIFGRYKKLIPGLSQSRWLCRKCGGKGCKGCSNRGKLYDSVEERIGEPMKEAAQAEDYVLHASGREDVDAVNTAGRPFVMMLKGPRRRNLDMAALAKEIGDSGEVAVEGLRPVPRGYVEVVTESHFDKTYRADVRFGRELEGDDIVRIKGLEGATILQKTPKRVVHRRADIVRHRRIRSIDVEKEEGTFAILVITAEAGTYIKELISGDGNRTEPSIAGLLGTEAECKRLEVTDIDDSYLDMVLEQV